MTLLAAMRKGHFIDPNWVDRLLEQATSPDAPRRGDRVAADAGSDEQFWGFSALEQGFERGWPNEEPYFPAWASKEEKAFAPDKQKWGPNEERQTLFYGTAFFLFDEKNKQNVRVLLWYGSRLMCHRRLCNGKLRLKQVLEDVSACTRWKTIRNLLPKIFKPRSNND